MMKKVKARYANGVLTPLEPLDLEEGVVVELNVESAPAPKQGPEKRKFWVVPNHSGLLPGMDDPKKMKQQLLDEDDEHFLNVQKFGKGT